MNLYLLIILLLLGFALLLIHAKRLITVSIALATVSALTSSLLYMANAANAAVIELSVGAGLVAVLFTFTNSLLAERNDNLGVALPRLLALCLTSIVFGLLLLNRFAYVLPVSGTGDAMSYFWEERGADVVAIMALMFSTVLGVLALLVEREAPAKQAVKESA